MPPGEPDPAASVVSGPAEGEFDTEDDGEQRQGSLAFENLDAIGALASIVGAHGLTRNQRDQLLSPPDLVLPQLGRPLQLVGVLLTQEFDPKNTLALVGVAEWTFVDGDLKSPAMKEEAACYHDAPVATPIEEADVSVGGLDVGSPEFESTRNL